MNHEPAETKDGRGVNWSAILPPVFLVLLFATVAFTHLPQSVLPEPYLAIRRSHTAWSDKAAHIIAYGVLTIGIWFWLAPKALHLAGRTRYSRRVLGIVSFLLVLVISLSDEITQIPFGRNFEFGDVASNLVGGVLAISVISILPRFAKSFEQPAQPEEQV